MRIEAGDSSKTMLQKFITAHEEEQARSMRSHSQSHNILHAIEEVDNEELLYEVKGELWGHESYQVDFNLHDVARCHFIRAKELPSNFEPKYDLLRFSTLKDNGDVDLHKWESIYQDFSIEELENHSIYFQAEQNRWRSELYRILQMFAFYKYLENEEVVSAEEKLENAFGLNNRGDGLDLSEQKSYLRIPFSALDPVIGGLVGGYIEDITTNTTDSDNAYGSAKDSGTWLNLISNYLAGGVSTVSHEVGHAVQYAFGMYCDSSIDNRDCDKGEENYNITFEAGEHASDFQTEMGVLWEDFQEDEIVEVRPYQQKNFNEFFACAFEEWVHNQSPKEYSQVFDKFLTEKNPQLNTTKRKITA